MSVRDFIKHNYRHFNAAVVVDASEAYITHLARGGKMFMTIAGAMSTAELGLSLAEMIRQDKVHGICTTGANLEEDIFNLVAHNHYERVPHYRNLSDAEEVALRDRGMNRVTDTCIPEEEAMRRIERQVLKLWQKADKEKQRYFPYEYMYQLIRGCYIKEYLRDRSEGFLGDRRVREESADFHARLGRFDAGKYLRRECDPRRRFEFSSGEVRRGTNGRADRLVSQEFGQRIDRLLPDRGRHRGRLPNLRGAADYAGPSREVPALGLLLPDFRQHHVVRLLQRRGARTKKSPGENWRRPRRDSSSNPTPRSSRR